MAKVSVVITVFNEAQTIQPLLDALFSQTIKANEIIIVDAVSTDNTWKILQTNAAKHKVLKIFQQPGVRSVGRNYGMSKAKQPIIALTDAGCIPEKNWLENLISPFANTSVQVVSGYYKGLPKNDFELCQIPYVLVMPDRIPDQFFPSSRSMALRKSTFLSTGGFDPNLDPSEDFEYATRMSKQGIKFYFAQNAVVGWFPRPDLRSLSWMFLHFAAGDIVAGIFRPTVKRLATRYLIYCYLFFLAIQIPLLFVPLIIAAIIYLLLAIKKNYRYVRRPSALFFLPIIQLTADISVLFGSIVGLVIRMSTAKK